MNEPHEQPSTARASLKNRRRRRWPGSLGRRPCSRLQRPSRESETGSSLAYALVIALVVLVASAALASRTLFSTFGSAFNQDTRHAREAAEVGIQRTIAELNRERNRGLLADNPDAGGFWSNAEVTANPNRCAEIVADANRPYLADLNLIRSGGVAGTFTANPVVYIRDDGTLVAEQEETGQPDAARADKVRYAYQLVSAGGENGSIEVKPSQYDGRDVNGRLSRAATLRIRMRGFSYNNGQLTGSTTLEQQIEVLPKCCGRSLASFGSDLRSCNEGLGEGFGILLFTKDTRSDEIIGKAINLTVCNGTIDSQCIVPVSSTVVPVVMVPRPKNLPQANEFPFNDVTAGTLETCESDSSGCAPGAFRNSETNSSGNTKTVFNADTVDLGALPSYCRSETSNGVTTIHCLLDQLRITDPIVVRTSSTRRLKFYFPTEGAKVISTGTSSITHINTTPPSSTDQRLNDAASVLQLQFFGCRKDTDGGCERDAISTNNQTYSFNGNSGTSGDPVFFYFPIGDVTINGNGITDPQFEGVVWTNSLTGNGGVKLVVPGSGVNSLFASYGVIDSSNSGNDKPILWDFVARAVRSYRLLQGT